MERYVARMPRNAVRKEARAETLRIYALRSVTMRLKDIIGELSKYGCLRGANRETSG
jgi:hypothetical protein